MTHAPRGCGQFTHVGRERGMTSKPPHARRAQDVAFKNKKSGKPGVSIKAGTFK